jgi:hypothetical protein
MSGRGKWFDRADRADQANLANQRTDQTNALHIRVHIDLDEGSTHIRAIDVRVGKAR